MRTADHGHMRSRTAPAGAQPDRVEFSKGPPTQRPRKGSPRCTLEACPATLPGGSPLQRSIRSRPVTGSAGAWTRSCDGGGRCGWSTFVQQPFITGKGIPSCGRGRSASFPRKERQDISEASVGRNSLWCASKRRGVLPIAGRSRQLQGIAPGVEKAKTVNAFRNGR